MAATVFSNPTYRKTVREHQGKQRNKLHLQKKRMIEMEGVKIAEILEELKEELEFLYNSFDYITDPILVDGCIYEIKALHMKYQYFLKLCKDGHIVFEGE